MESEGKGSQVWYIDLQPVDPDEGKYLIASSRFSVSQAKK